MKLRGLIIIAVLFIAACAGPPKRPPDVYSEITARDASRLVEILKAKNAAVSPCKGIGQIGIYGSKGSREVRAAWIATPDGRLRVEALGLTGQPFAKMICSHSRCYFLFRGDDNCLRMESTGDTSLELLVGIELEAGDVALLLAGGVPIKSHDSVAAYETASGEKLLVLKRRFSGTVQTVRFSADRERVREMTVFGWAGELYRAEIIGYMNVQGRDIPSELRISDFGENRMRVSAKRCRTGIKPPEGVFTPNLPEEARCDNR
ncbi:MAG: hypothetical protein KGY38_05360 [Desulfobacterales bacterium]|nr:hypothetical protein [Desulfobacterales bacterium]